MKYHVFNGKIDNIPEKNPHLSMPFSKCMICEWLLWITYRSVVMLLVYPIITLPEGIPEIIDLM